MEEGTMDKGEVKKLMDEKINLLEKLMAEKTTESAMLKKYFFAISAINQRKKFATRGPILKTINLSRLEAHSPSPTKQVSTETANKISYHAPKPEEYETYRYKNKDYEANNQPLPRSSYNR